MFNKKPAKNYVTYTYPIYARCCVDHRNVLEPIVFILIFFTRILYNLIISY